MAKSLKTSMLMIKTGRLTTSWTQPKLFTIEFPCISINYNPFLWPACTSAQSAVIEVKKESGGMIKNIQLRQ